MNKIALAGAAIVLALPGCSSRPREFSPVLAAAPADQAKYEQDVAECGQLLADGKLTTDGRLASAGAGAAATATTAVAGAAAASSAGLFGGMAIASATVVALPFVALAGAWGMAKIKRTKKEKAVQAAIGGCLQQRGYTITDWRVVKRTRAPAS